MYVLKLTLILFILPEICFQKKHKMWLPPLLRTTTAPTVTTKPSPVATTTVPVLSARWGEKRPAKAPPAKAPPTKAPPTNPAPTEAAAPPTEEKQLINSGTSLVRVCLQEEGKMHIIIGAYVHDGWTMILGDPNFVEDKDELLDLLKIYKVTLLMGSKAWDCTSGQSATMKDIKTVQLFHTAIYLLKTEPFKLGKKESITVFTDKIYPEDDICHTFNDYCLKDGDSFVHKYLGYPKCEGEIEASQGKFNYCDEKGSSKQNICADEIETVYTQHPFVFCNGLLYGYVKEQSGYIAVVKFNARAVRKLYQTIGRVAQEVHREEVPDE